MNTYVKISLPKDMTGIANLLNEVTEMHNALANESPLSDAIEQELVDHWTKLKPLVAEIVQLRKKLGILKQQRDVLMGFGESVRLNGTSATLIRKLRDSLLGNYRGMERELMNWGFNVTLTSVPSGFTGGIDDGDTDQSPVERDDGSASGDQFTDDGDIGIGEDGVN